MRGLGDLLFLVLLTGDLAGGASIGLFRLIFFSSRTTALFFLVLSVFLLLVFLVSDS